MTVYQFHLKHYLSVVFYLCVLVTVLPITVMAAQLPAADGLIVKFRATASISSQIHALSTSGLRTVESFDLVPGLTHVRTVAGETIQSTLASILTNPNVEYAEPNYYVTALAVPNDPDFSKQYGLHNIGQTSGTAGADIDAVNAWDLQTGKDVIIAIIDTGVEYTHEDLIPNVWTNVNEIPGNGIDDDNNGFIDDVYGWDFSNNDSDPIDDMGHGTHVAGIIAANTNNGIGISGINWRAKIMALKFIDAAGIGTTSNAIKAINYAVAMGAKISNNSWGGGAFTQGLYDTLSAANDAGHLFIAASGNNSTNTDDPANEMHYPSSYDLPNVISVAATDEFDSLGTFSNYGPVSVDLAAPGRQILSLWLNNGYLSLDGTSMAAPFVAGAAGILLSTLPNLSINELRSALLDNVDLLPGLNGLTVTGGRLNLFNALNSISANIIVTPLTQHLAVNGNVSFFASGGSLPYTWRVSNPAVAQIDSASGLLVGLQAGITQVIVEDANGFAARTNDISVDQLTISPMNAVFDIGQSIQFTPSGGVPPYSWISTNTNAIQVDSRTGLATGVASGQGLIILQDSNGLTLQSELIEVIFIPDLLLSQPLSPLTVGDVYRFIAEGGIPPYVYGSLDTSIATIDSVNGTMNALRTGIAKIFVEDSTGKRVTYSDIQIQAVQVFSTADTMRINETQVLNVVGGTPPFEWRVTNSLVASIDFNGVLTAIASGTIKVTVMDMEGNLAATDIILITDSRALSLESLPLILKKDQEIPLIIAGGIPPYSLTASNTAVLSVNENTLLATAKGEGFSFITITDSVGEVITTDLIEVRDIIIFPQVMQYLVDDTVQFSAAGGVAPYTWTVDNLSLARIDIRGAFVALAPGKVNVSAKDADGIVQTVEININNGTVIMPSFDVTPRTALLSKRSSNGLTFVATGGVAPYTYKLSSPVGTIDSITGQYSPLSDLGGNTTVVVTDAIGNVHETGMIQVR